MIYLKKYKSLYFMMIPGIVYFIIYKYLPMFGISLAFMDFKIINPLLKNDWVWFENFKFIFGLPIFTKVLRNTICLSLLKILLGFPAPIIVSIMLNEIRHRTYKRTIQTIIYLPHFMSWIVVYFIAFALLAPDSGVITGIIKSTFGWNLNLFSNPNTFWLFMVGLDIWKGVGWGTIIYLAALSNINPELYEAAKIDGANKFREIIDITIPSIVPVIVTLFILRIGTFLTVGLEQLFIFNNAMVNEVGLILDVYSYRLAFSQSKYHLGAAVGLFQGIIGMILVVFANKLSRKLTETGLW